MKRDDTAAVAPLERVRRHLVSLRMPRALETLEHVVQQLERGQISAIEALDGLCQLSSLLGPAVR